jgi:hypothetical protein
MHPYCNAAWSAGWHGRFPLPLGERVAEGRVRGALADNSPLTPAPSPAVGRGENGDPQNTYPDSPRRLTYKRSVL